MYALSVVIDYFGSKSSSSVSSQPTLFLSSLSNSLSFCWRWSLIPMQRICCVLSKLSDRKIQSRIASSWSMLVIKSLPLWRSHESPSPLLSTLLNQQHQHPMNSFPDFFYCVSPFSTLIQMKRWDAHLLHLLFINPADLISSFRLLTTKSFSAFTNKHQAMPYWSCWLQYLTSHFWLILWATY